MRDRCLNMANVALRPRRVLKRVIALQLFCLSTIFSENRFTLFRIML
jgi:hypothetical protein